ncbi:hypothetical protein F383_16621 [Gossypium arboreum]|uniref:Uncharacterized protein n=2 Tax=Gossypium arboreum TaxID=29729 RepID=A0A0B0NHL3_GOSAR|nr:hypothetical protein F383_16621 [Gossypium arboreum]
MLPHLLFSPPPGSPQADQLNSSSIFSTWVSRKTAMARMKLMALALVILMMGNCCLATNRKVIKVEVDGLKHEQISVHGRQLLDDSGSDRASYPSSSTNNHHFRPRQDFPGGGTGDGSGSNN